MRDRNRKWKEKDGDNRCKEIIHSWEIERKRFDQHAFIPFAFDIFGFLAPEVASLLQRVQAMNVIFKRISFVI
jgi:hypothetical protein